MQACSPCSPCCSTVWSRGRTCGGRSFFDPRVTRLSEPPLPPGPPILPAFRPLLKQWRRFRLRASSGILAAIPGYKMAGWAAGGSARARREACAYVCMIVIGWRREGTIETPVCGVLKARLTVYILLPGSRLIQPSRLVRFGASQKGNTPPVGSRGRWFSAGLSIEPCSSAAHSSGAPLTRRPGLPPTPGPSQ